MVVMHALAALEVQPVAHLALLVPIVHPLVTGVVNTGIPNQLPMFPKAGSLAGVMHLLHVVMVAIGAIPVAVGADCDGHERGERQESKCYPPGRLADTVWPCEFLCVCHLCVPFVLFRTLLSVTYAVCRMFPRRLE